MLPPKPDYLLTKKATTATWSDQPLTRKDFLLLCGGAVFSAVTVVSSVTVIGRVIAANHYLKYSVGRYGMGRFL
jgi:hypothetical protein